MQTGIPSRSRTRLSAMTDRGCFLGQWGRRKGRGRPHRRQCPAQRSYDTVAGLILPQLQHLAQTGEHIDADRWLFIVIGIDGRRIDKALASQMVTMRRCVA
jgi:hypothetical protein